MIIVDNFLQDNKIFTEIQKEKHGVIYLLTISGMDGGNANPEI